jgi:predicted MFS family arabinose efflux permease
LGWLSASTNLGVMIGPAIGSLAFRWGPAAPGLCAAALCVCNILFAWMFLPETNPSPGRPKRHIASAVFEVVRHPGAPQPRLIWIYALGMLAQGTLTAVLALYLKYRFAVTEHSIGYFFVYTGFLSVVLRAVLLGPLVDRFGETRLLRTGAVLLMLAMLLFPVPHSIPVMALVLTLFPAGTALLFPAVTALVSHESDPKELGQTMGVQQAFGGIARVVGPVWAAAVFQVLGPAYPFLIAAAILAVNGSMAFRVPLVSRYREPVPAD